MPKLDYSGLTTEEMEIGLQVAKVGLGRVDYVSDVVRLDQLAAEIFGLTAGVDIAREDFHKQIHRDDWPEVEVTIEQLSSAHGPDVVDLNHRTFDHEGKLRWVNARKRVFYDPDGDRSAPRSAIFAVVDGTSRKMAELQSQMLIGELNHRTKNLITVVASIARQLRRHSTPEDFPDRFIDRLQALARNQEATAHGTAHGYDLKEIIAQQVMPFEGRRQVRLDIDGPRVEMASQSAHVMAMMCHELLTNAAKYGALAGDGRVEITWRIDDDECLHFDWVERGGPPVSQPERTGYGTQVVTVLAAAAFDAKIKLEYPTKGFRLSLVAPLEVFAPQGGVEA
ncbi:sensor histidine kinase [Palleronia sp.]|uniref:sensor histidine kinase n=1 Tax=Palleronia sp. TaxID=1940284 RepID=UPI0035C83754